MEKFSGIKSNLVKKTCLSVRVDKLEISLEKNIGKILKCTQDDFRDVEEMLSLLSPRELSKPHHKDALRMIDEGIKSGRKLCKVKSKSPDCKSSGREFIVRKIRLGKQRSLK